jgi:hypothetical protein
MKFAGIEIEEEEEDGGEVMSEEIRTKRGPGFGLMCTSKANESSGRSSREASPPEMDSSMLDPRVHQVWIDLVCFVLARL